MKPEEGQGLTTRDVARILGVSIATVIRYFDKGILTGWKNPITGRMVIDLEGVQTLKAIRRKRSRKKEG
jgi:predicted site-specific integrase-resolvase